MNLLRRRKAFIFVQELKTLEDTKRLLTSKLQFLSGQTKLTFNSICKSESITPEFTKSSVFLFDWHLKILNTLIKLSNSSDLEWLFLKLWSSEDFRPYLLGLPKYKGFLIDTDKITKQSDKFFFELMKLGILDVSDWLKMNKLKNYVDSVGLSSLHDDAYFECKHMELLSPVADEENNYLETDFADFLGKALPFKSVKPITYRFMRLMELEGNKLLVSSKLKTYSFQYSDPREDDKLLSIPKEQHAELMEVLSEINSLENLCRAIFEISIMNKCDPADSSIVKFLIGAFFSKDQDKQDSQSSFEEKVTQALLWVDCLECLCDQSINMLASTSSGKIRDNFLEFSHRYLSPLLDKEAFQMMLLLDPLSAEFVVYKIKKLRNNAFYKKTYAINVDKYFAFEI